MSNTQKQSLAREYVLKFPAIAKGAIALKLYEDYPAVFRDKEDARMNIRRAVGSNGPYSLRKEKQVKYEMPQLPPSQSAKRKFIDLPQIADNILWLSDVHIPNQENEAIELALDYGKKNKINCIVLGGDILDNTPFTSHDSPPPSPEDVADFFDYCEIFLKRIRTLFPTAHIIWLEGNHDAWYVRYLMKKAPMLFNDPYYRIPERLNLKQFNIDYYEQNVIARAGKLHMHHGHLIIRGIFSPVNAARGVFTKAKSSMIIGHVHSTSEHSEGNIKGEDIGCWSVGCLCTLAPDYDPFNTKHNLGFAHIKVDKNGDFQVFNKRIINNKVF